MNMFVISADEICKAADELRKAQERGFVASDATFRIAEVNDLGKCNLTFMDVWDKAHPTDGRLNWGRQGVSKYCRVVDGRLVEDK